MKNILFSFTILVASCFYGGVTLAQETCNSELCVIEFNASWNKQNSVSFLDELTDCEVVRVDIDKGTWQADYNIVVVPTVIIFNGDEVKRFQADLSFKVNATQEDLQLIIDDILLSDF